VSYSIGRGVGDDSFTAKGFTSWKKALEKNKGLLQHHGSAGHRDAADAFKKLMSEKPITQQVDEQHDRAMKTRELAVAKNRKIVGRLFSLTRLMGRLCLPFRGHNDVISSLNKGVFWEMVEFMANNGDEVLHEHLRTAPKNATYLSHQSQNEMITIVGEAIREDTLRQVREAGKFVIMLDETKDLSHTDRVSLYVRYVRFDGGVAKIEERLLAIVAADRKTGEALEALLLNILEKYNLNIDDIVGQCYDGGSNLAGVYKGVQARILEKNPLDLFTYCYAHSLNRVVVNACNHKDLPEARNFFRY